MAMADDDASSLVAMAANVTTRAMPPSSPSSVQKSVNDPVVVGVMLTVSVNDIPGAITVPSGSDVCGMKRPAAGGLDFVIVRLLPPVLLTVKLIERVTPTGTSP
jgi:hypothetical protein